MKTFKATITNDFKNSIKRKEFNARFFVAKYGATSQRANGEYKIIIDREDERRVILRLDEAEFNDLLFQLNTIK